MNYYSLLLLNIPRANIRPDFPQTSGTERLAVRTLHHSDYSHPPQAQYYLQQNP